MNTINGIECGRLNSRYIRLWLLYSSLAKLALILFCLIQFSLGKLRIKDANAVKVLINGIRQSDTDFAR